MIELERIGFSRKNTNRIERIWLLSKTDFKLLYAETYLGFFWTMITPLFRLTVYYIIFSAFFVKNIPNYGLHIFSGLLVWMFFMEATKKGMGVVRSKRYLIENIKMNILDLYISSLLTSLLIFFVNLVVYMLVASFFDTNINWTILYVPIQIIIVCILIFGVNLILSAINIYFRDISKMWEMILFALFWVNPIFYAKALIFEQFPILLYLNPVAGIIINTRNGLLMGLPPDWGLLLYDLAYALIVLGLGILGFKKFFHNAAEKL